MANINILAPFILYYEGGYVNDPCDKGGPTNHGVTLNTWKAHGYDKNNDGKIDKEDIKLLTENDAVYKILKPLFWDKCKANEIKSQSVANVIVDWVWGSGFAAMKKIQGILGVKQDAVVGPKTIEAINNRDSKELFETLWKAHEAHYRSLSNFKRYGKGWLRRLNGIGYGFLKYGNHIETFNN